MHALHRIPQVEFQPLVAAEVATDAACLGVRAGNVGFYKEAGRADEGDDVHFSLSFSLSFFFMPLAKGGDGEGLIGWLRVKNEERKKEGKKERGEGRIVRGAGTLQ